MLSFLRTRSTCSSSPPCEAQWDGRSLALRVDVAWVGERVAIDLDGCFFADAPADADGCVRFDFGFAPKGAPSVTVLPRRTRDGMPLADAPFAIRFGEAGIQAAGPASTAEPLDDLGDVGALVPFGIDCDAHEVAIIVPVYNAPALVGRCLDSLVAHTTGRARLIVIDDASPDPQVAPLLARYAGRPDIRVLRNERNHGFTATANRGMAEAGEADVVLLNADAEVGPNWLTGLRRAAFSRDDVATVTAVSDNAGAFSVPELEQENAWPACWTFAEAARALWQHAGHAYPELPTGNGFCMYIRRAAIDAVGAFDEAAFPQGYGEENDFCQRASALGMRHLIAGNVYVRHTRSSSFGHERRAALGAAGMAVLRERWPRYEADVGESLHSFERRVLDWRVRRAFAAAPRLGALPRVLCAGHACAVRGAEAWRLAVRGDGVDFERVKDGARTSSPIGANLDSALLDEYVWRGLQSHAIEAVIDDGTLPRSIARAAGALGIPFARAANGEVENALRAAFAAARSFTEAAP
jgi:GT2 family glycosyltransferase